MIEPTNSPQQSGHSSLVYDGSAIGVLHGGAREGETFVGSLHLRLHATAPETSAWAGTTALMNVRSLALSGCFPTHCKSTP